MTIAEFEERLEGEGAAVGRLDNLYRLLAEHASETARNAEPARVEIDAAPQEPAETEEERASRLAREEREAIERERRAEIDRRMAWWKAKPIPPTQPAWSSGDPTSPFARQRFPW